MSGLFAQITVSLDGFTTGPNDGADHPLGEGGLALHRWILDPEKTTVDARVSAEMMADAGAFVIGRRMAEIGLPLWGPDGAFGKPCFIVTHRPAPQLVRGPTTFAYVTGGLAAAVAAARGAAGERSVCVAGGADIIRQALALGLLEELRLTIAPILLGSGRSLWQGLTIPGSLTPTRVIASPFATHITYRIHS